MMGGNRGSGRVGLPGASPRASGRFHSLLWLLFALLAACGDTGSGDGESLSVSTQAAVSTPPASLTISLPGGMLPQSVPVLATRSLLIKDRAKIQGKVDGYATVVNTGTTNTSLGVEARTGDVWSKASVTLANRARVEGFVKSTGSVTKASDAVIVEGFEANVSLGTLRASTFVPQVPAKTLPSYDVQPSKTVTLAPGGYGNLSVKGNATAKLSGGNYSFDSITLESQSKLVVDDAVPVVVYVRNGFTHRGKISKQSDSSATNISLLVIPYGTTAAFVEAPFKGTLYVPNASLTLQPLNGAEHVGSFFAKDLTVEAGVLIRHQAFPWSTVLPPTTIDMSDPPVKLRPSLPNPSAGSGGSSGSAGTGGTSGTGGTVGTSGGSAGSAGTSGGSGGTAGSSGGSTSSGGSSGTTGGSSGSSGSGGTSSGMNGPVVTATVPAPVTFRIPIELWVKTGNAGHGTAKLTFRIGTQTPKVCTYTGGSPTNSPTTDLDLAKGRRYLFPSCTGGAVPGTDSTADQFTLEIVSAAENLTGTTLALDLGGRCTGSLPAEISPEEVVVMRENFNWRTVDSLPETDPDGLPALWHGLVYIDRPEQLQALDRWRVYWSTLPISEAYMAKFAGQCGRVEHASDGMGLIVYAVLPAKLFNILRTFSIEAVLKHKDPPFKFIIPSTPDVPDFTNTDGSIRYAALASSGFTDWLAARPTELPWFGEDLVNTVSDGVSDAANWIDDNIIDPAGDVATSGFSYVTSGWDAAVDWATNAIDDTWEAVQIGLGDLVGLVEGDAQVTLDFHMLNRDPLMLSTSGSKTDMIRVWGPNADAAGNRPKIYPRGVNVSIRQWGLGFLPVLNQARLGSDGRVVITTLEGEDERAGDGLCLELENEEAMMTTDFAPNEVCDFFAPDYKDFGHDARIDVFTDQQDLHSLTQIVDGADYARTVMGWEPGRVDVLIGWVANSMTGLLNDPFATISPFAEGESRAMALCLDFPAVGPGAIDLLGLIIPTQFLTGPLLLKDIWFPDDHPRHTDSRAVMTHEYGHFLMCDLLYNLSTGTGSGPPALTALLPRVLEGQNDSRDDEIALVTESWADTFAMQVTGGSNYITSHNATDPVGVDYSMGFCTQPSCMDWNYQGQNDFSGARPFKDELAKVESTIHDAFDRSDSANRLTGQPWNGDVWRWQTSAQTRLEFSPSGYLAIDDDPVSLSGLSWLTWVESWLARGGSASREDYFGGLSDALAVEGYNWCERCEAFAAHEFDPGAVVDGNPTRYVATTFGDHFGRWAACNGSDTIKGWLGSDPPEQFLNMDLATCHACPPLQYSDQGYCSGCPYGQVPRGDHCEPCAPGQVAVAATNSCSACGRYEITVGNACIACPFGEVADRGTNTCVACPADLVVDISTFSSCSEQTYVTSVTPAASDTCPEDFWIDVVNVQALLPPPSRSCTSVAIRAGLSGLTEAECLERRATLEILDQTFTPLFGTGSPGTWVPSPLPGSTSGTCDFGTETIVEEATLAAGVTSLRVRAAAFESTPFGDQPLPTQVAIAQWGSTPD